jgi:outer membrane lipoprotein-sorting protein
MVPLQEDSQVSMRLFTGLFMIAAVMAVIPARAVTLPDVLTKMDAAAPRFQALSANLKAVTYTKVIDDKTEEDGSIVLKRPKAKELQVMIDFTKPDPRTISFRGKKAELYLPKAKTVQEYDLGKQKSLVEQFLLLGFGTSGKDLNANYNVSLAGEETVGGQKGYHLVLDPKDAEVKKNLRKLELWISEDGTYPLQQKVWEPSGNYRNYTYTDVKVNPNVTASDLALKLPSDVKREFPQRGR